MTGWYERRWVVEEYHKAQKTGCRIEDMQFTTTDRLEPAIALLSVVAVTLLNLREASRRDDAGTRRADTLVSSEYIEVLSLKRYGTVRDGPDGPRVLPRPGAAWRAPEPQVRRASGCGSCCGAAG